MGVAGIVQVAEMFAVVRQHGSSTGVSECQHVLVWDPKPARSASATVSTSWPNCLSTSTVGAGKFSSAKRGANR
jgi:hypothetical protein